MLNLRPLRISANMGMAGGVELGESKMTKRVHYHPNLIFSVGTQVVTLRDVARESGVSVTTGMAWVGAVHRR